jgi:hypothetical protein
VTWRLPVRDHAFLRKHRTEVTEATEGNWKRGNGLGDMAASSARSRVSKKHRTEVTEATEGELEKGKKGLVT